MAPVTGIFQADFTKFFDAVNKAEVELKTLDSGADRAQQSLNRIGESFGGRKIIQEATLAAKAVEDLGGATKLTTAEQARLNALVTEAIAKYDALGKEAPADLKRIADQTKAAASGGSALGGAFTTMFSAFSAANLATTALGAITGKLNEFVQTGLKLPAIEQGFRKLAGNMGTDAEAMRDSLHNATKGMVSDFDLMQSANKAMLLGLPVTKESMADLAQAATALGRAMGLGPTQSLDDLITALGRSSPMILDNLGLTVKVGEANEAYAEKLGKTVEELTDAEKKMAFYEAAMEAARRKTQELGEQSKTLGEIIATVWTSIGNVVSKEVATINVGLGSMLSNVQNFLTAMVAARGNFGAAVAAAASIEQGKQAQPKPDVNLPAPPPAATEQLAAYRAELARVNAEVAKLSGTSKATIAEATKLGQSAQQIATGTGLAADVVKRYQDQLKEQAAAQSKATQETKTAARELDKLTAEREKAYKTNAQAEKAAADAKRWVDDLTASLARDAVKDSFWGAKARAQLKDGTADAIAQIKLLRGVIEMPVDETRGLVAFWDSLHTMSAVSTEKTGAEVRRLAADIAGAMGQMASVSTGAFGGVTSALAGFVQQLATSKQSAMNMISSLAGTMVQVGAAIGGTTGSVIGGIGQAGMAVGGLLTGIAGLGAASLGSMAGIAALGAATGGIALAALGAYQGIKAMVKAFDDAGRDTVESFAEAMGGFDALHLKLAELGEEGEVLWIKLTQGVGRNNPEQAKKVIDEVSWALANQKAKQDALTGATEEQALATIETATQASEALKSLGPKLAENEEQWREWGRIATEQVAQLAEAIRALPMPEPPTIAGAGVGALRNGAEGGYTTTINLDGMVLAKSTAKRLPSVMAAYGV